MGNKAKADSTDIDRMDYLKCVHRETLIKTASTSSAFSSSRNFKKRRARRLPYTDENKSAHQWVGNP